MDDMEFECMEEWNPGTLTDEALAAYAILEDMGRLKLKRARYFRDTGRVQVFYDAGIPHEWVVEHLRETKEALLRDA